jgi:CHAP domain-containing protein
MKLRRYTWVLAVLTAAWLLVPVASAHADPALGVPAKASCAKLAAADPSATNGAAWGQTLLRGHGAPGGWFGVDVCANAVNSANPGGANLSCDRAPADFAHAGCAPGRATYDGFGLSFQCVELVARFAAWAFDDAPGDWHGDAPDLWLPGNHPLDMVSLPNGGTVAPVPGDVLVWGAANARGAPWPSGPNGSHDGHVAVVAAVTHDTLTFVEQNALSGGRNVARESIRLTQLSGRWIAGGYSGSRILYGWLHSFRNTGAWTGARAASGVAVGSPTATAAPIRTATRTATAAPAPFQAPALDAGVMITPAGTLTALAWSGGALTAPERGPISVAQGARPTVSDADLGAPAGTTLALSQAPIVLAGTFGDDIFALGRNGQVYAAHLAPHATQAAWSALGAPPGVVFAGGVAATATPGAVIVGAVATNGILWWRAGPPGNLSNWAAIGQPVGTPLIGPPVIAGEPGSGLPFAMALGRDGQLHVIEWSVPDDDGADMAGGWGQWSSIALPASAGQLMAPLYATVEAPVAHARISQWADGALDLVACTTTGAVWLLRRGADGTWSAAPISTDGQSDRVVGVVAPPAGANDAAKWLHVYTALHGVLSLGEVALSATAAPAAAWTAFDATASLAVGQLPPTALAVGPRASVLASVNDGSLTIIGTPAALTTLTGAP